jgi:hypothetical protein
MRFARSVPARRVVSVTGIVRINVGLVVACAGLVAGTAPAGAAPAWSLVGSPNRLGPPNADLGAVACPSATTCLTVGRSRNAPGGGPRILYVERWDGTARTRVAIETPVGFSEGSFADMDCTSTTNCFAVGSSGFPPDTPLVERWNGTEWSLDSVPVPASTTHAWLTSIACPSPTLCLATGNAATASSEPDVADSFVDRWDGTSWSLTTTAVPVGGTGVALKAISCVDATDCFAVGSYATSAFPVHTLSERWNGTAWAVVASPNPFASGSASLVDVACSTATSCIAIGAYSPNGARSFSEHWNGLSWSLLATATPPIPPTPDGSSLQSVSCTSSTDCFAAGRYSSEEVTSLPWLQHFDGANWTNATTPNLGIPVTAAGGGLAAVSCATTAACLAVGSYQVIGDFDPIALVDRFDGTKWSMTGPPAGAQSQLAATDCPSATLCFAVGNSVSRNTNSLVARWNGTTWIAVPTPNPVGATRNELRTISCASTTNCFAVGSSIFSGMERSLTEWWNGTSWSILNIPNPPGATGAGLSNVSCPTSTRCVGIGFSSLGDLTAQWNGTTWSVTSNDVSAGGSIEGLSCATPTSCFAVGSTDFLTLVRRWNGTTWSTVASPNGPSALFSDLSDISCSSTSACVATGAWDSASASGPLVERWNGATWTSMTTPAPPGVHINLDSVSCPSDTDCVAVGSYLGGGTVVETLNGGTWTITPSANRSGAVSSLRGVSCVSPTNCLAVGNAETNLYRLSLVEQYR